MKVAVFSARSYDRDALDKANAAHGHDLRYIEAALSPQTAAMAAACEGACIFVNDRADADTLQALSAQGVRLLALRCSGFNHVDVPAAQDLGLALTRVAEYSPYSVAEHTVALLLALNRHLLQATRQARSGNFALDGLIGSDLHGKTVGIIGVGRIGSVLARILQGFGCRILANDVVHDPAFEAAGHRYVPLDALAAESDVISLHCPLTDATRHLIDARFLGHCKPGLLLVNTSRGAVLDTAAALQALDAGRIAGLALDVYEFEAGVFFEDRSASAHQDPLLAALQQHPKVVLTGHQGFFTREAMHDIAESVLAQFSAFARNMPLPGRVP